MKINLIISIIILTSALLPPSVARSDYSIISTCTNCNNASYSATLKYNGKENYYLNQTNPIVQELNFTYCFKAPHHLVVRITDAQKERWEVPHRPPFPHNDYSTPCLPLDEVQATVEVKESPFSFSVKRKSTNETIFETSVGDLIYSDYYLQISTKLPSKNIYGLGERNYKFDLGEGGTFTIFNKDNPASVENATSGHNTYGYHPVYLQREQSNLFSMILLRSSNAMDVVIADQTLTYKVIGGILEFNMFLGDSNSHLSPAETVVKQYHNWLGKWILPPFWTFGHHQCKWGYENISVIENVHENYRKNNLPLDVIWGDIDYMDRYVNSILDNNRYPADEINRVLKEYKKKWVPIIDAGIGIHHNPYIKEGLEQDVFIKVPGGEFYVGEVWPGEVHFPDFFHPNTPKFWNKMLETLYKDVKFDGIWLDMNELASFTDGQKNWVPPEDDILNRPPYTPAGPGQLLSNHTIRMDVEYYGGLKEYYVHSMYGFLESEVTYNYLKEKTELPFVLSRSTFYGSGKYAFHWNGDNGATWQFLAYSIPGVMNFGLFGIPFVGPDMCGFDYNTTEELCSRWYQVGTLYPFSRNHNIKWGKHHEPYALGPTLLETARVTLNQRYSLLKHYYSLFVAANGTGTIYRPLFFEFPNENGLYGSGYSESQVLIGSSLMVAPVITEGAQSVNIYFPRATWYDIKDGKLMHHKSEGPKTLDYPSPLNTTVPMFVRGGHIISRQSTEGIASSDDLNNNFELIVALDKEMEGKTCDGDFFTAKGSLLGISNFAPENIVKKCQEGNCLYNVTAQFSTNSCGYELTLKFDLESKLDQEEVYIENITLFGDFGQSFLTSEELELDIYGVERMKAKVQRHHHSVRIALERPVKVIPGRRMNIEYKITSDCKIDM